MTLVRVVKTPPGMGYIPIGKQATFPIGAVVDVSQVDPLEVKHLLDKKYIEVVSETPVRPDNSGHSSCA